MQTIYGDTDSIFLKLPGALDTVKFDKTVHKLNKSIQDFSLAEFGAAIDTEIELDYYADRAYFTSAKKRYVMHVVNQDGKACDYRKIAGFETQRRDSTMLLREVQQMIFDELLKGTSPQVLEKQYRGHFMQIKVDLFAGKLDDKIAFTKGIRQQLSDYATSLPHTRAAKILQDLGMYQTGSDIEYYVIGYDKVKSTSPCGECDNCKHAASNDGYVLFGNGDKPRLCTKPKKTSKLFIETYPNVSNRPAIKRTGYSYVWQNQVMSILERVGMYVNDKEMLLDPQQKAMSQFWLRMPTPLIARGLSK